MTQVTKTPMSHPHSQVYSTKHKGSPSPRKQSPVKGGHGHGHHGGHKSGVNIMADLAVQGNKRNLLVGAAGGGSNGSGGSNFSPQVNHQFFIIYGGMYI